MKLTKTTKINIANFDGPIGNLEVKYGLPSKVKFCSVVNGSSY